MSRMIVTTCYLCLDPRVGVYFRPVILPLDVPREWGVFVDGQRITNVVVNGTAGRSAVDLDLRHPPGTEGS